MVVVVGSSSSEFGGGIDSGEDGGVSHIEGVVVAVVLVVVVGVVSVVMVIVMVGLVVVMVA